MRWAFSIRRWFTGVCATALAYAALTISVTAHAQDEYPRVADEDAGMDTHLFRPAVDSKGFFYVNGTDIIGKNDISFGMVLDWGRNIMRTSDSDIPVGVDEDGDPVDCDDVPCDGLDGNRGGNDGTGLDALIRDSFQGTFHLNYGILNRAVVGVTIPVILMSADNAYNLTDLDGNVYDSEQLSAQKISGFAPHVKVRLTRVDQTIGVAAILQGGWTFGDAERDLGGEPGFWYWPRIAVENHFGSARRLKIGLDVGYRGHTGKNASFGNAGWNTAGNNDD